MSNDIFSQAQPSYGPGPRTQVRRLAERGRYDRDSVHAILDEGFVCHLGVCVGGQPVVLPQLYVRQGDVLYLHGAPANSALQTAEAAKVACVSVTLVDALVLARSAFHHSVNYRSVVAVGPAAPVSSSKEKEQALLAMVDHVVPGRSAGTRRPSPQELRATRVTKFHIEEASAKIRDGGPKDDPEDLALEGVWAGVVPLELIVGAVVPDAGVSTPVPSYIASLAGGRLHRQPRRRP